jgi:hypothetical protein
MIELSVGEKLAVWLANVLKRWGMRKASEKISNWLYNKRSQEEIYEEVYEDIKARLAKRIPDLDAKWTWMLREFMEHTFGDKPLEEMRGESVELLNTFNELLPKKYPLAMITLEAYKADKRHYDIMRTLKVVLANTRSSMYSCEVMLNGGGESIIEVHPKFTMRWRRPMTEKTERKQKEAEKVTVAAIAGKSSVDAMLAKYAEPVRTVTPRVIKSETNESYVPIKLSLVNDGEVGIEKISLILTFPDFVELTDSNVKHYPSSVVDALLQTSRTIDNDEKTVYWNIDVLTPERRREAREFFLKIPAGGEQEISVRWSLSSMKYVNRGEIIIKSIPEYEYSHAVYDAKIMEAQEVVEDYVLKEYYD